VSKKILVINDDPVFDEVLRAALSARGHQVEICLQPQLAFGRIKKWQPDLVALDIAMPGRSGWEIVSQMRSDPRTAKVPILITPAAHVGLIAAEALLLQGMRYDKLRKPFELDDFLRALEHLLHDPPPR